MVSFVLRSLREAAAVIPRAERATLSERDADRVDGLLKHPLARNRRLFAAARTLPHASRCILSPRGGQERNGMRWRSLPSQYRLTPLIASMIE